MRTIIAPSRYVQGPGAISELKTLTENLGQTPFVIASSGAIKRTKDLVVASFGNENAVVFEEFNRECSKTEIERLKTKVLDGAADIVIGIGGGKTLDTAKAVAHYSKLPVVIVPTIASTDAPCSALSVIYTDQGEFEEYLFLPKNPELVLMDSRIIVNAPARLLVAGMGDALATYFEAKACEASGATSCAGGLSTKASVALAELCYDTLLADGYKAKLAAERKALTSAVENIIEANTYLSGIGFESAGLAGAHAVHNGLTVLSGCHEYYHGEKVAFGTLVQLFLANEEMDLIDEVAGFCLSIGLPVCLDQLGLGDVSDEEIRKVAEATCAEGETVFNMPFDVGVDSLYAAILAADAYGKSLRS
ncbi:MAG: glycerol dehydrogenase [Spirochaetales bacterium]|uniref:Glycerol dehydrogenase n=1 Tax=Candidatus Thalassospirochaeta sargassi TaxID=3119039 RepID=A0AAJ1ID15_9SPIO|nr:glycerol dehydrogenase [Spirochaetales bacterium]